MIRIAIIILIAGILFSCTKQDDTTVIHLEGIYIGYFEYRGTTYWSSISFEEDRYIEWPSGGIYYQKSLDCLTEGTYTLDENTFTFTLDSFKYSNHPNLCESDLLLPGEYRVIFSSGQDSLVFEKGAEVNTIIYYLAK